MGDLFIIICIVGLCILVPHLKYSLKLHTYFAIQDAYDQRANARKSRKSRKPYAK